MSGSLLDSLCTAYGVDQCFCTANCEQCGYIFGEMLKCLSERGFRQSYICHLLLDIFDCAFSTSLDSAENTAIPLSTQVKDVLDRHLERTITVSDIAKYFCKSTKQIERVFEADYGVSVYKYLRNRRFTAACRELRCSNESITSIAARFKLASVGKFSSEFAKRYGMSPSSYRKILKNPSDSSGTGERIATVYDFIPYISPCENDK